MRAGQTVVHPPAWFKRIGMHNNVSQVKKTKKKLCWIFFSFFLESYSWPSLRMWGQWGKRHISLSKRRHVWGKSWRSTSLTNSDIFNWHVINSVWPGSREPCQKKDNSLRYFMVTFWRMCLASPPGFKTHFGILLVHPAGFYRFAQSMLSSLPEALEAAFHLFTHLVFSMSC